MAAEEPLVREGETARLAREHAAAFERGQVVGADNPRASYFRRPGVEGAWLPYGPVGRRPELLEIDEENEL
jgi:hypothetical protein